MRGRLLGFVTTGSVSLSSVEQKHGTLKVASQGQGGIGKTTMAIMIARDPLVRASFDVIGWVSVGQRKMAEITVLQQQLS